MSDNIINEEIFVRPYLPGDEERIVPFLEMYMGWRAPRGVTPTEHWLWKYRDNPVNDAAVCVAEDQQEIVSAAASVPSEMIIQGKPILAAQGTDLCTSPEYRGKGLIGKVSDCRDRLKEDLGVKLDYGFPNKASAYVSLEKRGFRQVPLKFVQYRYVINMDEFFQGKVGKAKWLGYAAIKAVRKTSSGSEIEVREEQRFGEEFRELFEKTAKTFDLLAARRPAYLNWRYADPRAGQFKIFSARRNSELVGYIVIGKRGSDAAVADLLVAPQESKALDALINRAISYAKEIKAWSLLCLLPKEHRYGRRFPAAGFLLEERYTGDVKMSMIWKGPDLDESVQNLLKNAELNCHITLGDTDWI